MVSWRAHRVLGDFICSFHSSEIDHLIDSRGSHDASRYDADVLERTVDYIRSKYDDRGLCYFILHHYLDRLVDILTSLVTNCYESYALGYSICGASLQDIYQHIKSEAYARLRLDPKNILTLLVFSLEDVLRALHLMYSGKHRRNQRRFFEELLRKAHAKISSSNSLTSLRDIVIRILNDLYRSIDCVLCIVLGDEGFRSKGTLNKIAAALTIKVAKYRYYTMTRSPTYAKFASRLLDKEKLSSFISYIMEASCSRCQEQNQQYASTRNLFATTKL